MSGLRPYQIEFSIALTCRLYVQSALIGAIMAGKPARIDEQRDADRFWEKVAKTESGECWEWLGNRHPSGYGIARFRKCSIYAHRLAWVLCKGAIPQDLCVLHKCDNPPCCNPEHLFLGTQLDNVADRVAKGRTRTPLPAAKITAQDASEIRRLYHKEGLTQVTIASRYGIKQTNVSEILRRKTWSGVEDGYPALGPYIGSAQRSARLTEDAVRSARKRHASGEASASLAKEYGVSQSTMWAAIFGKTWGHL